MARPKKPTNVLNATGAFKKNPKRKKERLSIPIYKDPIGNPPDYFTVDKTALWNELKKKTPKGILHPGDRFILEGTVHLICELRLCPTKFSASMYSILAKYLGMLGLTPVDRYKLDIIAPKKKEESEFFS